MENTNDKTAVQMPEPGIMDWNGHWCEVSKVKAYGNARAEEARREGAEQAAKIAEAHTRTMVNRAIRDTERKYATQRTAGGDAAFAAIEFALKDEYGLLFLKYWNEGEFDIIRFNWPGVPESVFIGADHLYKQPVAEACDTCHGAGVQCVGTSGSAEDGDAPVFEPCAECGYGEPVAEAAAQADDGKRTLEWLDQFTENMRAKGWTDDSISETIAVMVDTRAPGRAAPTAQPTPKEDAPALADRGARVLAPVGDQSVAQPAPPDDERAAFEAWARESGWTDDQLRRCMYGYSEKWLNEYWEVWNARAALRQPGAVDDEQAALEEDMRKLSEVMPGPNPDGVHPSAAGRVAVRAALTTKPAGKESPCAN